MAVYHSSEVIEIDFNGVIPEEDIRKKMRSNHYIWNPTKKVWWAFKDEATLGLAKKICGESTTSKENYGLKLKIEEIVNAGHGSETDQKRQIDCWVEGLNTHIDKIFGVDSTDSLYGKNRKGQINAWKDCFKFIQNNLKDLSPDKQQFELIFEYSMPGTAHERPDILLLTDKKVISLDFKRKNAPQEDDNLDDVAQAIRYKEWLENHHKVTKDKNLKVVSYLVCTPDEAQGGKRRGVRILTKDDFCFSIDVMLTGEDPCSFTDEWLASPKTEMPDMLRAMEILYYDGKIPYIDDVNKDCLDAVREFIKGAKSHNKKRLILINGVPGSGKTAVGQCTVFEENRNGESNAIYLSGNRPLVEVIKHQIDTAGGKKHMGENAFQDLYKFKGKFFEDVDDNSKQPEPPRQSILVFDEAQRAWTKGKMRKNRNHNFNYSEPEGLLRVGDRIFDENGFSVLIGLYGNGQVIYDGEKNDLSIWEEAIKNHSDWDVIVSQELADQMSEIKSHLTIDNHVLLPISVRADFIDCSKWVNQAIGRKEVTDQETDIEIQKLDKTSMIIYLTRDFNKVRERAKVMDTEHPEWKYGVLISNLADEKVINYAVAPKKTDKKWEIYKKGRNAPDPANVVKKYGEWFDGGCKNLQEACTVFGVQGLEIDVPIIIFGGEYIRINGRWEARGDEYDKKVKKKHYDDPEAYVENLFRVLLTRARKEMIIVIPQYPESEKDDLAETYEYFAKMGESVLGHSLLISLDEDIKD